MLFPFVDYQNEAPNEYFVQFTFGFISYTHGRPCCESICRGNGATMSVGFDGFNTKSVKMALLVGKWDF